jgi:putative membrane-bound dehydrogenase-like protein
MRRLFSLIALAVCVVPALAQREFGFDNRKASGQPYLSPEETVKRMKVAPEFEVKLFAGEPQVVNPVAFTIDEKGRVWVVECFEYPSRTPPGKAPRDRIVILEDTDGDGACDKRTVFCEGKDFPVPEERKKKGLGAFDLCTGLEVGHGGVYVGAAPYLWFIENRDDKPGKFETLLGGFGSQDTHETLNTFQWGPDGWLYGLHGIFTQSDVVELSGGREPPVPAKMNGAVWRFHPKTKKFELYAEGTSNPWGMDWRNTDGQFILACCVIPHLYHIVPGGIYKRQAGASYNPYVYSYINEISDHTFHRESGWAHAGLISLDVPHMPEKYRNSVIFGSIHGCSIKQNILKPNGSSYTASRGEDFLVSGDKNVRPINMKWGPNGDIYLIDWHDQNPCHQAEAGSWDYERGRVYRIQLKGKKAKKAEDISHMDIRRVVQLAVESDYQWERRTAIRVAQENGTEMKLSTDFSKTLRMATFLRSYNPTIDDTNSRFFSEVLYKAATFSPEAKAFITRCLGDYIGKNSNVIIKWMVKRADNEDDAVVRRELAAAAIKLSANADTTNLIHSLLQRKEDTNDPLIPHLTWIAYEKLLTSGGVEPRRSSDELTWLATNAPDNPFITDHIIPKVMRRLVATGDKASLALCLKFVNDVTDAKVRKQALTGLSIALKDQVVDMPAGWAALQPELRKDDSLVPFVNQLAVSFRDPEAVKRAFLTMRDVNQSPTARAEAIRQLAVLKPDNVNKAFVTIIRTDFPELAKVEAARGLVGFDDPTLPGQLFKLFPTSSPAVRGEMVNTLASRKPWAKALLGAMKDGTVERTLVTDNTISRIQSFNDREINGLIETAWGRTRKTPAELQKLIDKTRAELDTTPSSFTRGKAVFDAQCAKCHLFDGRGQAVGPPLDGAGRDIDYLLANVIDPNRVIGAPYFLRTVTLLDGRVEQGVLAEEDDKSITLKVENGILKKLQKKDLDGPVKVQEKSMMPEGLTAGMSPADFRDLVRYAMVNPFVTHVTVNGQKSSGGVTGKIALPAPVGNVDIAFAVTAPAAMTVTLKVGCTDDVEIRNGETVLGVAKGSTRRAAPDQETLSFMLPAGTTTLTARVKHKGAGEAIYLRFVDPDRALTYPGD